MARCARGSRWTVSAPTWIVFVDGAPLEPVEHSANWRRRASSRSGLHDSGPAANGLPPRRWGGPIIQEVGGSPDARYWVEASGQSIQIRLASGTPADHEIEVTTRQATFVPAQSGAGFIRIKGLTFQHAANAYPFPQFGMISCAGGDHWIVEDNTIEWANGGGLLIGRDANSAGAGRPALRTSCAAIDPLLRGRRHRRYGHQRHAHRRQPDRVVRLGRCRTRLGGRRGQVPPRPQPALPPQRGSSHPPCQRDLARQRQCQLPPHAERLADVSR